MLSSVNTSFVITLELEEIRLQCPHALKACVSLALTVYPDSLCHLSMGDMRQSEQMRHNAGDFASTLNRLRKRTNNTSDPQYCVLPRLRHPVPWPPSSTVPLSSPWVS